ncbi:MAG: acetolactate synthase small subunit [Acidimicrobiales bacterium]
MATPTDARHHILSVLVENKAGVLTRVAGLFARRGFNIYSLAVAPTEDERFSRITMVVDVQSAPLEQMIKQLDKLVNVIEITELAPGTSVERELLIVTVQAAPEIRGQVIELVGVFEGRILNVGFDSILVSLEGSPHKLDDFENLLRPYGIVAIQRTGRVALPRLPKSAEERGAAATLRAV